MARAHFVSFETHLREDPVMLQGVAEIQDSCFDADKLLVAAVVLENRKSGIHRT